MATAQPGIFALATRNQHHLELDLRADADAAAVGRALAVLDEVAELGGANVVVGFGADAWARLGGEQPAGLRDFDRIAGLDGHVAPATQHDLWVWVHGTGVDSVFVAARRIATALEPVATLALDVPTFVFERSRDLTGFEDGTANPDLPDATGVALVPDGAPGEAGSFVITMLWEHDLAGFEALPAAEQDRVFGRTREGSEELDPMPSDSHVGRVEIDGDDGEELKIFRRSTPFGSVRRHGLFFVAFSAELSRYDAMLASMFGVSGDGTRDRLTDFSRPITGAYYFAPSPESLAALRGRAT